jgi:hypothetical protein
VQFAAYEPDQLEASAGSEPCLERGQAVTERHDHQVRGGNQQYPDMICEVFVLAQNPLAID